MLVKRVGEKESKIGKKARKLVRQYVAERELHNKVAQ